MAKTMKIKPKKREAKIPAWITKFEQDVIGAPKAYLDASAAASRISFPMKFFKKYDRIILICDGMSEPTAASIKNALPRVPLEIQSGYSMPYPSSEDCLAFVMTPGVGVDSENELSLVSQCYRNQTNTLAITCGGRLPEYCDKLGIMYLNIPESTGEKTLQDYALIVPITCLQTLGALTEPNPEKLRQIISEMETKAGGSRDKLMVMADKAAKVIVKAAVSGRCTRIITPEGLDGPALELKSFIESVFLTPASVHTMHPSALSNLAQTMPSVKNDAFVILNGGVPGSTGERAIELSLLFEKQIKRQSPLVAVMDVGSASELHLENVLNAKALVEATEVSAIKHASSLSAKGLRIAPPSRKLLEKYNEKSTFLKLLDEQLQATLKQHEDELAAKHAAGVVGDAATVLSPPPSSPPPA